MDGLIATNAVDTVDTGDTGDSGTETVFTHQHSASHNQVRPAE